VFKSSRRLNCLAEYVSNYIRETELLGAVLLAGFFWRRVERLAFLRFFSWNGLRRYYLLIGKER